MQLTTYRRSVLAVNRSRVANELLHEIDLEREQRKKAMYEKEEFIAEIKELTEEREKLQQELDQIRKIHADELAKESAKVKSQIEKFRKACEIQLEEERKDKDATIKSLQLQLKEAVSSSDQVFHFSVPTNRYSGRRNSIKRKVQEIVNE